jgi:hypothetical protein
MLLKNREAITHGGMIEVPQVSGSIKNLKNATDSADYD